MDKLKKGWFGVVLIGTLTSFFLSYIFIGVIYKYGSGAKEEVFNVLLQPFDIYTYVNEFHNCSF